MKHGKGTDLPGMTDPEGEQIGVVYVSPEDDRKTIGTAILAEEKLGREQIVLILPSQNKAFQSPDDFDYLKELRRRINAELIFVTPAGAGPAEFARQRRFPVFSTEESFVRSFTTGSPNPPAWTTAPPSQTPPASNKQAKKGWFGRGGARNAAPLAAGTAGFVAGEAAGNAVNAGKNPAQRRSQGLAPASNVTNPPTSQRPSRSLRPVPPQTPNPQMGGKDVTLRPAAIEGEDTVDQPDNQNKPGLRNAGLAGAAGLGAGLFAADLAHRRVAPTGRSTQGTGPNIDSDDDWDALPPAPGQSPPAKLPNTPTTEASIAGAKATSAAGSSRAPTPTTASEPNAIELPMSRGATRVTKKLPPSAVAGMATQAVPPSAPPTTTPSRRTTGKVATAGAVGAVAGAAAAGVLTSNAPNGGNAAAGATRVAGGSRPPMRNLSSIGPGGPGMGGPMNPRRTPPNRSRRRTFFVALILVTLLFLLGAWALSAHPDMLASVGIGNTNPPATITITPASKTVQDTYVMQGVVNGTADPASRQVTMRSLSSTKTTTKPANVTGSMQIAASQAKGTLTFFNGSASQVTIAPTTITNANGVQVIAFQNVTIPGLNLNTHLVGSATVNAHAVSPGAGGNIAAGTINGTCCLPDNSISVTNGGFSGGQDARNYNFLQVSDVNAVVNANQDGLRTDAQNDIKGQMKTGEQLLGNINCDDPKTTEDVLPGANGVNVTAAHVTVSITCNAQVFDASAVQTIAQQALQQKASKDPGPGYVLAGTIVTQAKQPVILTDSTTFPVTAQGVWYYPWTKVMEQNLFNKIKGKTAKEAQTILNSYPGVGSAKVSTGNGAATVPTDINQITFDIQKVTGLSGGSQPTGSGGTGGNSPNPSQATITPVGGNGRIPVQTVGPVKG